MPSRGQPVDLPITTGYYVDGSLPLSNQRCVNMYPSTPQADTVTTGNLDGVQGVVLAVDLSNLNDVCRGGRTLRGVPYFVIGSILYRVDQLFDANEVEYFEGVSLGVVDGEASVSVAENGDQLCIVAPPDDITAGKTYIYDVVENSFNEVTDPGFDGPVLNVKYLDGFFVFAAGDKFINSPLKDGRGLPDGAAYDPLDFSQAEADPDDITALGVAKNQLYVFGTQTVQIFRNIGRSPAPFVSLDGGVVNVGTRAAGSLQDVSGGIAFIGSAENESPSCWIIIGAQKKKISTITIDAELGRLTDAELNAVTSFYYARKGHFFYGFNLTSTTFVYDITEKKWHERQSLKGTDLTRYRPEAMFEAYSRIFFGDAQNGLTGFLDRDTYTEYGFLVRRFITTKPFDNTGNPVFLSMLEAVVDNGVGLTADENVAAGVDINGNEVTVKGGFDPKITLSWSDDGGRTFKGWLSRSMGKIGEYSHRSIWRKINRFPRSRVLMLEVSSPTKVAIIKLEARIRG